MNQTWAQTSQNTIVSRSHHVNQCLIIMIHHHWSFLVGQPGGRQIYRSERARQLIRTRLSCRRLNLRHRNWKKDSCIDDQPDNEGQLTRCRIVSDRVCLATETGRSSPRNHIYKRYFEDGWPALKQREQTESDRLLKTISHLTLPVIPKVIDHVAD